SPSRKEPSMSRLLDRSRSRPKTLDGRRPGHWALALRLSVLVAALALTFGCAILSPPPPREGGSTVGDAAKEPKRTEDDKHERLVAGEPTETPVETDVEVETNELKEEDGEPAPPLESLAPRPELCVGFVLGATTVDGLTLGRQGLVGLLISGPTSPRTQWDLAVLGSPIRFAPASGLDGALAHPFELAADLSARYQTASAASPFGFAPIVGFRVGTLLWDWVSPVLIDDGVTT